MAQRFAWGLWVALWLGLTLAHAGPKITFPTGTTSGGTPIPDLTCNAEDGFACLVGELLPDAVLPNPELLSGEPAPGSCRGPKHTMVLPDGAGGLRLWGCSEALGNPIEVGGRPGFNQILDGASASATLTPSAPDGTLTLANGPGIETVLSGSAPDVTVTIGLADPVGTLCLVIPDTAAALDNQLFFSFAQAVTITSVWCNYNGSAPVDGADFALEDGSDNAMTHNTPVCAGPGTAATPQGVTAANTLTAREVLRFDVTNTPDPATDTYLLCVGVTKN